MQPVSADLPENLKTQAFSWPRSKDPLHLAQRLEKWERSLGRPHFKAANYHRAGWPLASELSHVFVSLQELYPHVYLDRLDLFNDSVRRAYNKMPPMARPTALTLSSYSSKYRQDLVDTGVHTYREALETFEGCDPRFYYFYSDFYWGVKDLRSSSRIVFNAWSVQPSVLRHRETWSAQKDRALLNKGLPSRKYKTSLSYLSEVLVHEFGHAVESELLLLPEIDVQRVYGVLTKCLLGGSYPVSSIYHLFNYPAPTRPANRVASAKTIRTAVAPLVAPTLGSYSTYNRDELFAEAFTAATAGCDEHKKLLAPFLRALLKVSQRFVPAC